MVRTSRKIPSDWTKYEAIGGTIGTSRIFAFKTPLYYNLQTKINKNCRFTTLDLMQKLALSDQSLGLVINCNNTRRYYDKNDFEGVGICYKEVTCPGRGFLYRTDIVKLFIKTIDEFLTNNGDNDLLIGVNCSNGVNRSGFLICNYLITRLGWTSHHALNAFESARGYPIERGAYIQALHKADREQRTKNNALDLDALDNANLFNTSKKPKDSAENALDSPLAAQMMQQFYNMERQFKYVAETTLNPSAASSPAFLSSNAAIRSTGGEHSLNLSRNLPTYSLGASDKNTDQIDKTFRADQLNDEDEEIDDAEYISDDDGEGSSPNIDFDSMGKIDVREPASKSQQRRQRRQKREKMFAILKRGRFWEINEMRREMKD